MPKKFYKYKLLLDENMPQRVYFPLLTSTFDVKHIAKDLHKSGISDNEVYKIAKEQNRIVITKNEKDFIPLTKEDTKTGLIGVSPNISTKQLDKKLVAFLKKSSPAELFGKFNYISGES